MLYSRNKWSLSTSRRHVNDHLSTSSQTCADTTWSLEPEGSTKHWTCSYPTTEPSQTYSLTTPVPLSGTNYGCIWSTSLSTARTTRSQYHRPHKQGHDPTPPMKLFMMVVQKHDPTRKCSISSMIQGSSRVEVQVHRDP